MSSLPLNGIYRIENTRAAGNKFLATEEGPNGVKIVLKGENDDNNKWILKDQTLREGRDDVVTLQQQGTAGKHGFFAPEADNHSHNASVKFTNVAETIIATHVKEYVYTIRFTKKRTLALESSTDDTVKLTHITGQGTDTQQWKFVKA